MSDPRALTLSEAIFTTRAMRRMKTDPVPVEILSNLVEAATMGPTGSNMQNWRFIVVNDREKMLAIGEMLRVVFQDNEEYARTQLNPAIYKSVTYFNDHFADIPAAIFVGATHYPGPDASLPFAAGWFGSVLPAVQNLMLAARAYGLGTVFTTFTQGYQDQLRELLEVPSDVTLATCIPVGYPKGRFGRPERHPVSQVASLNTYGTPLPDPVGGFAPATTALA